MPTFVHGKGSAFKLDTVGGVLTDISTYITSIEMPFTVDTSETTTLGNGSKTFIQGTSGTTISLGINWDATIDAHIWGARGVGDLDFSYYPAGLAGVVYTGKCMITEYTIPVDVGSHIASTVTLQITGDVGRA